MFTRLAATLFLLSLAAPVASSERAPEADCSVQRNASLPACLDLPDVDTPITNFSPVVAPLAGVAAALGGVLGAGGSSPSTTSTSTTGTQ